MKKVLLLFVLGIISLAGYSQSKKQEISKDYYLQKSKKQRTTGWVLLGSGTALGIVAIIGSTEESNEENWFLGGSKKTATGITLGAVGAASSLASIPFFINARKNSTKASQLSLDSQRYIIPGKEISGMQPALSIKIEW